MKKIILAVTLVVFSLIITLVIFSQTDEKTNSTTQVANTKDISFGVRGNCNMCKKTIEKAVNSIDGVSNAKWDVDKKKIEVSFNESKTNEMEIHKAIASVGYDTEKVNADENAYKELPNCCQYDRGQEMNQKTEEIIKKEGEVEINFKSKGTCGMCKANIEKAANSVNGVSFVNWSVETQVTRVFFDPKKTNEMEIHKAIANNGYSTDKVQADEDIQFMVGVRANGAKSKKAIEKEVSKLDGVSKVTFDDKNKSITVTFNYTKTGLPLIQEAIANLGYDTYEIEATDEAYNKLPKDCQYDRKMKMFEGIKRINIEKK